MERLGREVAQPPQEPAAEERTLYRILQDSDLRRPSAELSDRARIKADAKRDATLRSVASQLVGRLSPDNLRELVRISAAKRSPGGWLADVLQHETWPKVLAADGSRNGEAAP